MSRIKSIYAGWQLQLLCTCLASRMTRSVGPVCNVMQEAKRKFLELLLFELMQLLNVCLLALESSVGLLFYLFLCLYILNSSSKCLVIC